VPSSSFGTDNGQLTTDNQKGNSFDTGLRRGRIP
jgi:hypothetical protein